MKHLTKTNYSMTKIRLGFRSSLILLLSFSLVSCVSYRPIFDVNQKYQEVGKEKADNDFETCKKSADQYLAESKKRRMGKEALRGAGLGSILGGIFGFMVSGDVKGFATGIAIGAGAGGVSGAGGVAAEDNLKPDAIKQRYISNCLSRQGYEIIGWE